MVRIFASQADTKTFETGDEAKISATLAALLEKAHEEADNRLQTVEVWGHITSGEDHELLFVAEPQ